MLTVMKLFFIGNRPKVLERWDKLLSDWQPELLDVDRIEEKLAQGGIIMMHLSSVESELSQLVFSYKKHNPSAILNRVH